MYRMINNSGQHVQDIPEDYLCVSCGTHLRAISEDETYLEEHCKVCSETKEVAGLLMADMSLLLSFSGSEDDRREAMGRLIGAFTSGDTSEDGIASACCAMGFQV